MRNQSIDDIQLINKLAKVFRQKGYEGATLKDLSEASGLKKASLYHRFPGGKEEMSEAILVHVANFFQSHVFSEIDKSDDAKSIMKDVVKKLNDFYEDGQTSCLLETMSLLGSQGDDVSNNVVGSYEFVRDSFAKIATKAGASKKEAIEKGIQAVAILEGGLIVTRITGDKKNFKLLMKVLVDLLVD